MKGVLILGLVALGGVVWWKHHIHASTTKTSTVAAEANLVPSGVNEYDDQPAAQRPGQVYAAMSENPDSVSEPGFAPAFGPDENV